ncbi:MAG: pyruvate carboxyltransferase [Firmicutes bacterium]|nr:pyruvate carboxyltransferase [Bacillota bacterium]
MYTPKFTLGSIPKKVKLGDITVRDGFQHEEFFVPTSAKAWLIEQAIAAGFKEIEITNFGNPRGIPQFKDNWEVTEEACRLRQRALEKGKIKDLHDVEFTGVAIDRSRNYPIIEAKKAGKPVPDRVLCMASTSHAHMVANAGKDHPTYLADSEVIIGELRDAGFRVCGTVSTIWGCPVTQSATDLEWATELTDIFLRMGASDIEHADHDGQGNPVAVYDYYARIMDRFPNPELHVAHFHVTRGYGLANVLAAMQAGITRIEATFGGIGGQPANFMDRTPVKGTGEYYYTNPDAVGLVTMEDLLVMLNGMGVDHGIDMGIAFKMGKMVEKICGRTLRSAALHFGDLPKYGEIKTYKNYDVNEWKKKYPAPRYPIDGVPLENWK